MSLFYTKSVRKDWENRVAALTAEQERLRLINSEQEKRIAVMDEMTSFLREQLRQRDLLDTMRMQQMPTSPVKSAGVGGMDFDNEDEEEVKAVRDKFKGEEGELL